MQEPLRDFYNRVIGWIETKPNGDKIGYDFYKRIVGYYEKQNNVTRDFYKRIIAKGDVLASLIWNANTK